MNFFRALALVATQLLAAPVLHAQAWPSKPVRLIVPFPPGGTADIVARLLGEKLAVAWGQPVLMDYKPGAGGTIAAAELVRSTGGHTFMIGTLGTTVIAPALYKNLSYDIARDVVPVSMLVVTPMVLVASPTVPAATVSDFVGLVRANPGKFSYASPGNGTLNHLMGEQFKQLARIEMEHIPYKGGTYLDLIAGRTAVLFDPLAQALPQIRQGNLRALAVSHRSAHLPNVPTFADAGYPDLDVGLWVGLFAPAGTPAAVLGKVSADAVSAMKSVDARQQVDALSSQVAAVPHESFSVSYRSDLVRWKKAVDDLHIRID